MRKLAMWTLMLACLAPGPGRAQIGGCVPDLTGSIVVDVSTSLGTIPIELAPIDRSGLLVSRTNHCAGYQRSVDDRTTTTRGSTHRLSTSQLVVSAVASSNAP